jgi:hypothetical protein
LSGNYQHGLAVLRRSVAWLSDLQEESPSGNKIFRNGRL